MDIVGPRAAFDDFVASVDAFEDIGSPTKLIALQSWVLSELTAIAAVTAEAACAAT